MRTGPTTSSTCTVTHPRSCAAVPRGRSG